MSIKSVFQRILGIPSDTDLEAVRTQQATDTPMYRPEPLVPKRGIEGVADDGSAWEFWRTETASGLNWYRRISAVKVQTTTPERIHGIDAGDHEHYDAAVNIERQHAWLMNDDGLPEETDSDEY